MSARAQKPARSRTDAPNLTGWPDTGSPAETTPGRALYSAARADRAERHGIRRIVRDKSKNLKPIPASMCGTVIADVGPYPPNSNATFPSLPRV